MAANIYGLVDRLVSRAAFEHSTHDYLRLEAECWSLSATGNEILHYTTFTFSVGISFNWSLDRKKSLLVILPRNVKSVKDHTLMYGDLCINEWRIRWSVTSNECRRLLAAGGTSLQGSGDGESVPMLTVEERVRSSESLPSGLFTRSASTVVW